MNAMPEDKYGSENWFNQQYGKSSVDPWGLDWRPSQALRYERSLAVLKTIEAPVENVLDVGCAAGDFTRLLVDFLGHTGQVIGVDFIAEAVDRARARYPTVSFQKASLLTLAEKHPGTFDLITCLEVLYYIEPSQHFKVLDSLKQLLKPKAYCLFSSFVGPSPYFSPGEFQSLIAQCYEVVAVDVLHLRLLSQCERVIGKVPGGSDVLSRIAPTGVTRWIAKRIDHASWAAWAQSASHTIVLAKQRN